MRLFIAIEFSGAFRNALCGVMDKMRRQGVSGNYTRPENLHLTLAFIGQSDRTEDIIRIMSGISGGPFAITLDGMGRFGDLLWVGVRENPRLTELAESLCCRLRRAGFPVEERAFRPHITLVRRSSGSFRVSVPPAAMTVRSVSLMKSERIEGKLVYTAIHTHRL